jgi:hypothetical protein
MTSADLRILANAMPEKRRAAFLAQLPAEKAKRPRGMNKTEAAFAAELEKCRMAGGVAWYEFESVRLHLGGGATFKPDFPTLLTNGSLVFYEVKGSFCREAARVRIKVAAGKFPHWRFVVVTREGGEWRYEEIKP